MARASPIQTSFNAGEFSPRLAGRVDVGKYGSGCAVLEGFIPLIQGPALRRGGFRYVGEVKDSTKRTWLVRFEYNSSQAFILEFGDKYIRFWANHGQVVVSGVAAYNGATAYVVGDLVSSAGVNYYCIAPVTGTAPPNATYWYPLTGSIYEIPSPYSSADLTSSDGTFNLRFAPSADVCYITCATGTYAPRKLSRYGSTNWQLTTPNFSGGPFKDENTGSTTIYASAATGAVTLTASAAVFTSSMVGALIQLREKSALSVPAWEAGKAVGAGVKRHSDGKNYTSVNAATTGGNKPTHTSGAIYDGDTGVQWQYNDPGFGCVRITGYTSPTVVNGNVESPFPENPSSQLPDNCVLVGNATTRWSLPAWSDAEGWPTQVAFFRDRLCFGRGIYVWQSVAGDYEVFTAKDNDGNVTTDMAIRSALVSRNVNPILWMEPNSASVDSLICGTSGGMFAIKSMTENMPYGVDNNTAVLASTIGSKTATPVQIGAVVLFVQRSGSKLRDITFDFYSNQFQSNDQSVMAEHIPRPGLTQIVYQQEPYSLIWAVRSDGVLVCMTYSREQYPDVPHGGWHRHPLGGSGVVESIASIPAPDGSRDELWAIVRRTINGSTKRYVEYLEWERKRNDDPEDAFYVDCGLTLNNTQAVTLTPGTGATVKDSTGVTFNAGSAVFSSGDVGRQIHYRTRTYDDDIDEYTYSTSKATITQYLSATSVLCTIDAAFPSTATIAAGSWRLTVTTVSGLGYLEGQTVAVLGNGAVQPSQVVSGGSITLDRPASNVQVGLSFKTQLQTLRFNAGGQDGTSQGKKTVIGQVVVRLDETLGLQYGNNFASMYDVNFRSSGDLMDNPPPIFSGDKVMNWPGQFNMTPWLCFSQPYPLPATIIALMPQVIVSDKG